jgi:hypothetical protein
MAAKKFPVAPAHPERNCWGCDLYCAATSLRCGNGSERTQHPVELFGPDWLDWQPPSASDDAGTGAETAANAPAEA